MLNKGGGGCKFMMFTDLILCTLCIVGVVCINRLLHLQ